MKDRKRAKNKKRHKIQNDKVKSKQIFLNELVVSRSLWYFVSKAVIKRKVGNANSY